MSTKHETPPSLPVDGKSHGQIYYESITKRAVAWAKLSSASRAAYEEAAKLYDAAVK